MSFWIKNLNKKQKKNLLRYESSFKNKNTITEKTFRVKNELGSELVVFHEHPDPEEILNSKEFLFIDVIKKDISAKESIFEMISNMYLFIQEAKDICRLEQNTIFRGKRTLYSEQRIELLKVNFYEKWGTPLYYVE